jgi:hypothetical protein
MDKRFGIAQRVKLATWNVRRPMHKGEIDNELKGMKIHIYVY